MGALSNDRAVVFVREVSSEKPRNACQTACGKDVRRAAALGAALPVVGLYAEAFTGECGSENHTHPLRSTSDCSQRGTGLKVKERGVGHL
jgi:hypothetical protein